MEKIASKFEWIFPAIGTGVQYTFGQFKAQVQNIDGTKVKTIAMVGIGTMVFCTVTLILQKKNSVLPRGSPLDPTFFGIILEFLFSICFS